MQINQQLSFLQQKIQELGSAICFNLSDSVLKFPTTLVNTLEVDDYGYVWFWAQKPKQYISEFENGFPVRLDFYKKGKTYFLQVTGQAWMVTDPEAMYQLPAVAANMPASLTDMVLVKVKMLRADYHETATAAKQSRWFGAVTNLFTMFRHSSGGYAASGNTYFPAS